MQTCSFLEKYVGIKNCKVVVVLVIVYNLYYRNSSCFYLNPSYKMETTMMEEIKEPAFSDLTG